MFTGIVGEVGTIRSAGRGAGARTIEVAGPAIAPRLAIGDSVAVNGICLTVTALRGSRFRADLSPETLRATTASRWRAGDSVHLEPSLRAADAIGGHFVLGHVDGVGRIVRVIALGGSRQLVVSVPAELRHLLLPKGSIAVDGVSLTLDDRRPAAGVDDSFTVTLIPQTLRETRFGSARVGEVVNLEMDVLAKAGRRAASTEACATNTEDCANTRPRGARHVRTVSDILARGWGR